MANVLVIGSINQDFILKVERRPEPGETVSGADLITRPGGKGANQAVAAALLGASVAFLGRVGDDAFGEAMVMNLRDRGVDTRHVQSLSETSTGAAFITVTPDGENAIVVSPGANHRLTPSEVVDAKGAIQNSTVLVAQMELELETVLRAVETARSERIRVVLNLAPVREVPGSLLRDLDPLVVNEHEASFLLGRPVKGVEDARETAPKLLALGPRSVVVTLGAAGAVVASESTVEHFPSPKVTVVDTTGAGDAFVGALSAKLVHGLALEDAVAHAVRIAAAAVTKEGAQNAFPDLEAEEN